MAKHNSVVIHTTGV